MLDILPIKFLFYILRNIKPDPTLACSINSTTIMLVFSKGNTAISSRILSVLFVEAE